MKKNPENESVVTLKSAVALKQIFEKHRSFDDVEINEKSATLSEAEGTIDSLQPNPEPETVFAFRKNDQVYSLPYEAIDLEKFEGATEE